jgi:hypothetical protein
MIAGPDGSDLRRSLSAFSMSQTPRAARPLPRIKARGRHSSLQIAGIEHHLRDPGDPHQRRRENLGARREPLNHILTSDTYRER